jgi:alpha-glucuronidase
MYRIGQLVVLLALLLIASSPAVAEDGYELWLRYRLVDDDDLRDEYRGAFRTIITQGESPTLDAARNELSRGLTRMLGRVVDGSSVEVIDGSLVLGTAGVSPLVSSHIAPEDLAAVGDEGFVIRTIHTDGRRLTLIAANQDIGVLYGAFHVLRHLQMNLAIDALDAAEAPRLQFRMLNHWDNLDRTVERGYAGFSFWDWQRLPHYMHPRYRLCAGECLDRNQRHGSDQRQRQCGHPAAGMARKGSRTCRCFPALRHQGLPDRTIQRTDRARRPSDG